MKRTHRCHEMICFKLADTNNMKFNINKFKLLRYVKEREIKSATTYKSWDDSNIDDEEQVRDLGKMMSNTATFTLNIKNIVKNAREKMGRVLKMFQSWQLSLMQTLLKYLVIPLIEYCCQLRNPRKGKEIQAIKDIQQTLHTKSLKYST